MDLSNLKVGDTVHLRCGGSIVVPDNLGDYDNTTWFGGHTWFIDGRYCKQQTSPFDIISITPKPEPKRIKGWLNVYESNMLGGLLDSREDANAPQNITKRVKRIACIYIDVTEGDGL